MKKPLFVHLGWLAAVVAAFAVGRSIENGASSSDSASEADAPRLVPSVSRGFSSSSAADSKAKGGADRESGASASRTPNDMRRTVAALQNESDPVKRNYLFAQLLMNLNADNVEETYAALMELRKEGGRGRGGRDFGRQLGLFFQAWAEIDGEGAVQAALASAGEGDEGSERRGPGRGGMDSTMGAAAALSRWVRNDPEAAKEWLASQEDGRQKTMLNFGLVNGLAREDPDAATAYVLAMLDAQAADPEAGAEGDARENRMRGEMTRRWYQTISDEQLRKGIDSAIEWANTLPDGEFKGTALNDIARRYVRDDIGKAAEWVAQFAGEEYARAAVVQVSETLAREDPEAAVDWITGLPEESQGRALYSTFDSWARSDPTAASEYLRTMDASPAKDRAISGFARELDRENPAAAAAWATAISDETLRSQTMNSVARSWYRTDAESATVWMQESGFSEDMQKAISTSASRGGPGGRGDGRGGGGGGGARRR